ncbi:MULTISPECIES: restriction endonuclease subunit S [Aeromonas]|uniref:restriction endonuclease subunit S n=1 Tax=Aeromonas TaxID=642 RepID=UPI0012F42E70|nr:restriction endonuclease subunit S [Aeromonas salmonicida]VXA78291.1 hypothetical protein AERO9A_230172 [Aeromonas salmonicida]
MESKNPYFSSCNGWDVAFLKDISLKIGSGSTPRGGESAYISERTNFAFIRSQNIYDFTFDVNGLRFISDEDANKLKGVHLQKDDVLLNITGDGVTFSRCCLVPEEILPAAVNQHVAIIRLDTTKCLPGYLMAYLCLPETKSYIESFNAGGSRRAITKGHIESFEVPLPPMIIQEHISRVTLGLLAKQYINIQLNQTLEQMAQALFKSWFVDFDPVVDNALDAGFFEQDLALPDELLRRAEARRTVRESGNLKPLPDATRQLFPAAFEECAEPALGLGGWVPQGWEHGCVADVARYSTKRIDTEELTLENYISTENMLADRKGFQSAANLPTVNSVPAYTTGSILISNIRPYFKKIWLANGNGGHSNDVLGFEAKNADTECYVFNLMYQDSFFDFMMATSKGSKMPRGDKKAILEWGLIVPPLNLRLFFSEKVSNFYTSSYGRHHENITLAQLRDTLLPKLISGELRLDQIEADFAKEGVA